VVTSIQNKNAETVANAIFKEWFCKFGIPAQIHTDGGKEFVNKLSAEMMELMNVFTAYLQRIYHLLPPFTTFHQLLPTFTTFYHLFPPFTTFYHLLPHFTTFYHLLPPFTIFYHLLPPFTTFYHLLPPLSNVYGELCLLFGQVARYRS
jgi:hypothetical protein